MHIPIRERLLAGLGTAIIVALLGYALILGLDVDIARRREQVMALLDLRVPPPPPPHPKPRVEHPKASRAASAASPPNLRHKAAAIAPPPPVVKLPPPPPPLVTAPKAGTGMAPSAGASDRPGPGQGAGGRGNGTGAGGEGDGDGGTPPRAINDKAKFSYLSSDVQAALKADHQWHIVGVRYRVEVDGSASGCTVTKTSGISGLDQQTCQAIDQHFRFHPARDPDGRKTWSTIVDTVGWRYDVEEETPPGR